MRREYVAPRMFSEEFVPNQRIASCGSIVEIDKNYKFICSDSADGLASCSQNSAHNAELQAALGTVFVSSSAGCQNIITATDPEDVEAQIGAVLAANDGKWKFNNSTGYWEYNPSGGHVVTLECLNIYEDPFKS